MMSTKPSSPLSASSSLLHPNSNSPVAIIGGGFSGICAAVQLKKRFLDASPGASFSITIFEENSDFGGVWLANKYPECAPQVPSHLYSFSFEPNPNWSKMYATQPEVQEYLVNVAKKHNLYQHTRFCTQVKSADWLESEGQWEIQILDKKSDSLETLHFKYVIGATGSFRFPNKPAEFLDFKGPVFHSSEWDSSLDLRDKKVGVIGSGASAIQIIPAIAPLVKELHSFQRRPSWLFFKVADVSICVCMQKLFFLLPCLLWLFRAFFFLAFECLFYIFRVNSCVNRFGLSIAKLILWLRFRGNKPLLKKLTPDYKFGCREALPSNKFHNAFKLPHVHLHRGEIEWVEERRIKVAGEDKALDLDVLILATGYRVQDFMAPLQIKPKKDGDDIVPIIGKVGTGHYLGVVTNALPNFFMLMGPNTGVAHNSNIFLIECQANFIVKLIRHAEKIHAKSVVVKKSAQDKQMNKIRENMKTITWQTESCGGWLKNDEGHVSTFWPGNCTSYWWRTQSVNFNDFEFTNPSSVTIEMA